MKLLGYQKEICLSPSIYMSSLTKFPANLSAIHLTSVDLVGIVPLGSLCFTYTGDSGLFFVQL